ncbi:lipopolysaccharide heptosyltransferase II [Chitinasiproducens palmae]|uniref:lipopolysaccharide heptosyltransferase II n=1 Tax=Chitinasiproducens palmae TaxID=1770053 RepID=A0A1H2PY64_9BURK|nr:lipopolysaccharide heptosyltransferase II [Chitinasiproducens palmae]SDV51635.1 heptosyltransferase-2 [Chitinasiproducens palmae]
MRRALIIAPNWIGDALMAQPLFTLLKRLHPRLTIDALAPPSVAPVLERMSEIATVHRAPFEHGRLDIARRWQVAADLREQDYDAAYVLPNSYKSALIPKLAGIRLRIGYRGEQRFGWLNVLHANPPRGERPSMTRHYAALAYAPGAQLPETLPVPRLEADLNEPIRLFHRFNLDTRLPLIALCPGAEYGPAKRWPPEHFATLARLLHQSFPYAQLVVLGTGGDQAAAQAIVAQAPFVRSLCGQTALGEACALISRATAVVSNDSGLMHVAAALRRPLIALFGSTDPRHTPPLSEQARVQWLHLDCSPCFQRECPLGHLNCLRELAPEAVFGTLRQLLSAPH